MGSAGSKCIHSHGAFRRVLVVLAVMICLITAFLLLPFGARCRALLIMGTYDAVNGAASLPREAGLKVEIPHRNMDFFPIMLTCNANEGISRWLNTPVRFTVDYAIADFKPFSGHSGFYDESHPLYNAYTGVYYLQRLKKAADDQIAFDMAAFDQRCLALPSIGLNYADSVFEASEVICTAKRFAGYDWTCIDAAILTNGPEHTRTAFHAGYIQYGSPPETSLHYPARNMRGRIYLTYLNDLDLNIGLYIIAKDEAVLSEIDQKIISRARFVDD